MATLYNIGADGSNGPHSGRQGDGSIVLGNIGQENRPSVFDGETGVFKMDSFMPVDPTMGDID